MLAFVEKTCTRADDFFSVRVVESREMSLQTPCRMQNLSFTKLEQTFQNFAHVKDVRNASKIKSFSTDFARGFNGKRGKFKACGKRHGLIVSCFFVFASCQ